jgi:hypothetical protein
LDFADHLDQLAGLAFALVHGQQAPIVSHVNLLPIAPFLGMAASHLPLPRLDPQLRPQHRLFLHRQLTAVGIEGPIVRDVVGDLQLLLGKGGVRPYVSRALIRLQKLGMGPKSLTRGKKVGRGVNRNLLDRPITACSKTSGGVNAGNRGSGVAERGVDGCNGRLVGFWLLPGSRRHNGKPIRMSRDKF